MVIDMKLEFCGKSDIGQKREINQDMLGMYQKEDAGLFQRMAWADIQTGRKRAGWSWRS